MAARNPGKRAGIRAETYGLTFQHLKEEHRRLRVGFPEAVALRTHRALSWLQRAEREEADNDARFIFLWIAFNAAYAREIPDRAQFGERRVWMTFIRELIAADSEQRLYDAVWNHFPRSIRVFLDNQYVFQPYWDYQNGTITKDEWESKFRSNKRAATEALGRGMNTAKVLVILFEGLYVLRNQLVHGGATWNSTTNRAQVSAGAKIMQVFVPIVIHLIMSAPHRPWGAPCYPVISD
jgi:Apea-like HEPN